MFRTSARRTLTIAAMAVAGLLAVAPGTSRAQVMTRAPSEAVSSMDEHLDASNVGNWDELAKNSEDRADELEPWDAEQSQALWNAAHYHYFSGNSRKALHTMEEAAESLMHDGEVHAAASAFVRAAYLAAEVKRPDYARTLLRRAEPLIESDRLTERQRESLSVEIEQNRVFLQ